MKSKKIRVGIVGGGRWAHASHLPALASLDKVELAAISTLHDASSSKTAEKFRIRKVFLNWRDLVRAKDIDAVAVLSPPKTHYPIVKEAFKRGKHVLCEGPLGMNYQEAAEMLSLAEAKGLVHGYTRPKLYVDGCKQVKKLISDGSIGRIHNVQLTWRPRIWLDAKTPLCWRHRISQSPPLLSVVPIIMLTDLFGPVRSVCADFGIFVKKRFNAESNRWSRVTAPDYFHALMRLKSGVLVSIQAGSCRNRLDESGLWISATKASIRWQWSLPNKISMSRRGDMKIKKRPYAFDFRKAWTFDRDFIDAISRRSLPTYNFRQGVYEMKVIDAVTNSAKRKDWVCL